MTLTPEILVPRLGEYLVERGLISRENLREALDAQERVRKEGQTPLILGQILIQNGAITKETLDQAITEQIIQLRSALQEYNRQLEQRVKERTIELEQALNKLNEASQMKNNFVANVSHELRTPLTHVKGYIELLVTSSLGPLTTEQEQALHVMQRSTERLEKLIEDLLLFSMAERGQISLKLQEFDVCTLCHEIVASISTTAAQHKMTLNMDSPRQLPMVNADRQKIGWVIMQFIDNAIKFSAPGSQIVVKVNMEGSLVQISVSDTGIGIPPDKREEIFEPFHQLDGTSTRKAGGAGLGLSLAKKIIEAHGSVIHVTSKVGTGSQFKFLLRTASG